MVSESTPAKDAKRVRTRIALLEVARAVIRERGYERTTLEAVAERAGMTTGAIYGNFKNRNEMFVTLGQVYWAPIKPRLRPGASLPEVMRALADATLATLPDRTTAVVGRLTGLAHAVGDDDLRAQVGQVTADSYALGAEWLRGLGCDLPMPAEHLVRVIHALSEGLVLQRILTPDLVPDEVVHAAFDALARGAPRP
ncbi:MAG: helix-turn-helix domain-containing protein [Vicinamibacterales bacterium]